MANRSSRLIPIILFVAVAWMAIQYFNKSKQPAEISGPAIDPVEQVLAPIPQVKEPSAAPKEMGESMGDGLVVDEIDLGQEVKALVDDASRVLVGVTDTRSAGEAADRLGKINQALDMLTALAKQLPPQGRQELVAIVSKLAPGLDRAMEAAFSVPSAGDILGENANSLVQKLSGLAD